jgi:hypothetical protein
MSTVPRGLFAAPDFRSETDRVTTILLGGEILIFALVATFAHDRLAGMLSVLASGGVGALLGLLFSIPKRIELPASAKQSRETLSGSHIVANTSLEEVSDWLVKTIVGVGLVSWNAMLVRLDQAGALVGHAVVGNVTGALPIGVAILLASSIHGGMSAYLWFARHLPSEWENAFITTKSTQGLVQQRTAVVPSSPFLASLAREDVGDTRGDDRNPDAPPTLEFLTAQKYAQMRTAPIDPEDWVRGLFGGKSEVTNEFGKRRLTASVTTVTKGEFKVTLVVEAEPAPAAAVFFLHNTFPNTTPSVGFDEDGRATLSLSAWGAFTVGVLTDDGTTELELNLAKLKNAPRDFVTG